MAPSPWSWVIDGLTGSRAATVDARERRLAGNHARPLGTIQALDALDRPGTSPCPGYDAAEALLPILCHGQDDEPGSDV
ncbi:hypothetical protein [Streptomyces sp. NPDC096339]|uniref:hypothetical protein n=1 Tax=Streptomyces sp. NPDC096339 TaxID=3366086 RepID=UPI00382D6743